MLEAGLERVWFVIVSSVFAMCIVIMVYLTFGDVHTVVTEESGLDSQEQHTQTEEIGSAQTIAVDEEVDEAEEAASYDAKVATEAIAGLGEGIVKIGSVVLLLVGIVSVVGLIGFILYHLYDYFFIDYNPVKFDKKDSLYQLIMLLPVPKRYYDARKETKLGKKIKFLSRRHVDKKEDMLLDGNVVLLRDKTYMRSAKWISLGHNVRMHKMNISGQPHSGRLESEVVELDSMTFIDALYFFRQVLVYISVTYKGDRNRLLRLSVQDILGSVDHTELLGVVINTVKQKDYELFLENEYVINSKEFAELTNQLKTLTFTVLYEVDRIIQLSEKQKEIENNMRILKEQDAEQKKMDAFIQNVVAIKQVNFDEIVPVGDQTEQKPIQDSSEKQAE